MVRYVKMMDIKIFNQAKILRDTINRISINIEKIAKMKERENDDEFNKCRRSAYDALEDIKNRYESDFNAL